MNSLLLPRFRNEALGRDYRYWISVELVGDCWSPLWSLSGATDAPSSDATSEDVIGRRIVRNAPPSN